MLLSVHRTIFGRFSDVGVNDHLVVDLDDNMAALSRNLLFVPFADRLEVTSPGALQNSMTIEKMLAGQRSPRNSIIVEIMRDYGYVDARGMGVRRKIIPLTRDYAGRDAQFASTDDYLRVVIPARQPS